MWPKQHENRKCLYLCSFYAFRIAQASSGIVILYIAAYIYESCVGFRALPQGLGPTEILTRPPM